MPSAQSNFTAPVDFRLQSNPPDGLPEDLQPVFADVFNSMQQIFSTFVDNCGIGPQAAGLWSQLAGMPTTILASNMNRLYVPAFEPVLFGAMINLVNDAGVLKAQLANAIDTTKPCQGFCNSAGVNTGEMLEVVLHSGTAKISGLTLGSKYYLSAVTSGLVSAVPATAVGNIEQYLGVAIDEETLYFYTQYWIQH